MRTVTPLIVILLSVVAALEEEKSEEYNEDYSEYPKYKYEYGVNDPKTADIKKHWEKRDGDFVEGSYRFVQPDGSLRIVDYNSDGKNGFNAFVKFEDVPEHLSDTKIEEESYEDENPTEKLQDSFDFNFSPEEMTSITPPHAISVEKENEENLNLPPKNKSIHAYDGKKREQGQKGYEVQEKAELNESFEEEEEEEEED